MGAATALRAGLLLVITLAGADVTQAQSAYPERTITMIVPFPPGGVADTVARPVAEALARELKQTVVVENKVGAGVRSASARQRAPRPTATRCC